MVRIDLQIILKDPRPLIYVDIIEHDCSGRVIFKYNQIVFTQGLQSLFMYPRVAKSKALKNKVTKLKNRIIALGERRGKNSVKRLNKSSTVWESVRSR